MLLSLVLVKALCFGRFFSTEINKLDNCERGEDFAYKDLKFAGSGPPYLLSIVFSLFFMLVTE